MTKKPTSIRLVPVLLLTLATSLGGCVAPPIMDAPVSGEKVVRVTGYGAASIDSTLSPTQRHLLGVRAAKVDAYRNLAEQVQGLQVNGNSSVRDLASKNDTIQTYVSAYLRGARVVSTEMVSNGMYEAVVELTLAPTFFQCVWGMPSAPCSASHYEEPWYYGPYYHGPYYHGPYHRSPYYYAP